MPTDRFAFAARRRGLAAVVTTLIALLVLVQSGCTRDDVAAAIATFAVEARATIEPWGATAQANVASTLPAALATAKSPAATPTPNSLILAAGTAFATPSPTPGAPQATPTPLPTATPPPTATSPAPTATPPPSPTPLPAILTVDGGQMALLTGGFFQMGATADDLVAECQTFGAACNRDWFVASEPVHAVLLAPYYMDTHEVTNDAFSRFLGTLATGAALCFDQPCLDVTESQIELQNGVFSVRNDLAQRPAAGVTWYGAAAYCAWRGARLPSEAEWERAAGWDDAAVAGRRYPWGNEFHGQRLNFCDATCNAPQANLAWNDGYGATAPVGVYEDGRSPAGLYDMAGNVWEWVADWYDPAYYTTSPGADPTGPESGEQKVVRGGSWFDTGSFSMTAVRLPSPPDNADATLGFRCAADVP